MQQPSAQSAAIDALKVVGSQLIVLHHLSAYGPIAEAIASAAPRLSEWLYEYARMAVQVFLVVGGFLAARGFDARPRALARFPLRAILARYLRLVLPYLAALLLALAAAALARRYFDDDFVPAAPGVAQFVSHLLLANQWLGHEALSAGVWYVAADFQLFATLAVLVWVGRAVQGDTPRTAGPPGAAPLSVLLVAVLAIASLFWFNRDAALDDWAIYFFGAYAMGATVCWAGRARHPGLWLAAIILCVVAALAVDFRWRIVVALGAALVLAASGRLHAAGRPAGGLLSHLSRISYALFLVHFPVILVVSALMQAAGWRSEAAGIAGAVIAWAASIGAAEIIYRRVEAPAATLHRKLADG